MHVAAIYPLWDDVTATDKKRLKRHGRRMAVQPIHQLLST